MFIWRAILIIVGVLRFVIPFFIFSNPILVTSVSFLLDTIDSEISYRSGMSWRIYLMYDKSLDYWWYIFILIFSIHLPIFPIILILFVIRSIGHFLVLLTGNEKYFVYFPNVLEIYFIFYLISSVFRPLSVLFVGANQIIPLLITTIVVIPREYAVHIIKTAPLMTKSYVKWHKGKK